MYDEELAPDIQKLAQAKLKQARQGQPAANAIKPAAALPTPPSRAAQSGAADEQNVPPGQENLDSGKKEEGRVAKALRARQAAQRQAKARQYGQAGIAGAGPGARQKYRQAKNIIRVIRGGTLAGTSLGDVFFSLSGLFLSLIGEWVIAKFQVIEGYKMFDPEDPYVMLDKMLWYAGWLVVVTVLVLGAVTAYFVVYLAQNPTEVIKAGIGL